MSIASGIIKRLLLPPHIFRVISLQRNRKKHDRAADDAQLKLYHDILPGDFLHYGYFEDPNIDPLDMSFRMIYEAQDNYGRKLTSLITDFENPVFDVGCGMGGLLGQMNALNLKAIGLTPDKNQIKHIRHKYPNEVIHAKFEELDANQYQDFFGTLITSESLQYLKLDLALPIIQKVLKRGGKWIACDYFKTGEQGEKSGHNWKVFEEKLHQFGFKISFQEDITAHILPTIGYAHHWATKIGIPLKNYAVGKLKVKAPGFYYALEEAIPQIDKKIDKNVLTVNPEVFAANKRYILMVIERS
jgi:cyclopropane fatty-acyl-phospholipid synthase-like methyltransferase